MKRNPNPSNQIKYGYVAEKAKKKKRIEIESNKKSGEYQSLGEQFFSVSAFYLFSGEFCKLFFIISAAASSSIWVVSLCPGREGLVGGKVYNLARMFIDNLLAVQRKELFFWVATKLTQL